MCSLEHLGFVEEDNSIRSLTHARLSNTTWAKVPHPSGHSSEARHGVAFNPSIYHMPYSDRESGNAHFAHSNYLHIYERTSQRDTEVAQGPFSSDTTPEEVQLSSTWILASQISRFFGSTTLLFQFHTRFRHIFSYRLQSASLAASCIALSSN